MLPDRYRCLDDPDGHGADNGYHLIGNPACGACGFHRDSERDQGCKQEHRFPTDGFVRLLDAHDPGEHHAERARQKRDR